MNPKFPDHDSDSSPTCLCSTHTSNSDGLQRRRRLVVAFDGTEGQFGQEISLVLQFYSRIVKGDNQFSCYKSGIGTSVKPSSTRHVHMWIRNKWSAVAALEFESKVLSGYQFLSENYKTGDQIFLLGFSRGAYQARVLAAMITKVGLLLRGDRELIPLAFKMYMDPKAEKPIVGHRPGQRITTSQKEFKKALSHDVSIHFVGVWDTVSSIGVFSHKHYPGADRARNICFFRHALALDERRVKFIPEYMFAKKEWFSAGEFGMPRCKEVWFRGSHSDIGGGNIENWTSDNGAIPSRWMAYEAMLAGLEMTPFWGGIKVKDLEPKISKVSMTRMYKLLEYFCFLIKWEVHSEGFPPLLTGEEEAPPHRFSRASHRKRPRQIFDHQKLHSSVCLHHDSSGTPFARLPNSWINQSGMQYGWMEFIDLLRHKDQGSSHSSIAYDEKKYFRETVEKAGCRLESSHVDVNRRRSLSSPVPSPSPSPVALPAPSPVSSSSPKFMLPAGAVEWDLLDCDAIPALIGGVLRGTNVREFLERLEVLAYSDIGNKTIRERNGNQFSSMIRQLCGDEKYAELTLLAIRLAYNVFWRSDVDLYDSDIELWKMIHSKVESWNEFRMDIPASSGSLQRAVRLLHKTNSKKALVEIRNTTIEIFNPWHEYFTAEYSPPPVELRILLETAVTVEFNVQSYVLYLAVFSSPHFSDANFTKKLLNCLIETIQTVGGEMKKLAMLCFCVLCAIDEEATFDEELFTTLKPKFVEVGAFMEKMWELVTPKSSVTSHEFGGGTPKKTAELKELLYIYSEDLKQIDRSWAHDALDKAIIFPQNSRFHVVPNAPSPYRRSMPSAGEPSTGGPTGLSSLPSPWAAAASPPLQPSAEVDQWPLSTKSQVEPSLDLALSIEELPRAEHARSDEGH